VFRRSLIICLIVSLSALTHGAGFLQTVHDWLAEARFAAQARAPSGQIVMVDIDARSIAEVGRWPWPRRIHADLIRSLDQLGASEIAFDIDFSAPSTEADDEALEAAIRAAKASIILATFQQPASGSKAGGGSLVNSPLERFKAHAWPASVNVRADPDGTVRRYPLGSMLQGELTPSVGAMLGGAQASPRHILVDFSIAAGAIDRIPVADLLGHTINPERVRGKKVIIGASAIELRDFFHVPVHGMIPGALVQTLGAETMLQGRALSATGPWVTLGGLALIAAAVLWGRALTWRGALLHLAGLSLAIEGAAFGIQLRWPLLIDTSAWQMALVMLAGAAVVREIGVQQILVALASTAKINAQTLLEQVVADSFDGIVVVDDRGTIQWSSRSAAEILQPDVHRRWRGRPASELIPPELSSRMLQAIAACAEGAWTDQQPQELCLGSGRLGERTIEYVITPSRLHGGPTPLGERGPDRFVACLSFRDITDRRLAEKRLAYLARFDTLTGLPNRNHFVERLSESFGPGQGNGEPAAVLYFDLDRFKSVNDSFGHGVGDLLLQAVARRALELLPAPHVLARFGGDEFAVLWSGTVDDEALRDFADRLITHLSQPYQIYGHRLVIGASVGITVFTGRNCDITTIMKNVDTALYRVKKEGGGSYCFYESSMDVALQARQQLEVELWDALARREFTVAYQPQFALSTGQLVGVEALLRWHHPDRGFVSPSEFVPVAEEIGLMESLGDWVLQQACAEVAAWPGHIKVAVNVSPLQFTRGNMVASVSEALSRSGLPAEQLELEITESLFIQEKASIQDCMNLLRSRGVSFALDDFGTGYSSLSYIRKFPIDKIKIDRSFIVGIPHDQEAVAIVQAVVALANSLGIRTNAEGLETQEQIRMLHLLGCDEGQGFCLGRPQPAADIVRSLNDQAFAPAA
jgi:diguanylate cyclase (GGDEF)-like protein